MTQIVHNPEGQGRPVRRRQTGNRISEKSGSLVLKADFLWCPIPGSPAGEIGVVDEQGRGSSSAEQVDRGVYGDADQPGNEGTLITGIPRCL